MKYLTVIFMLAMVGCSAERTMQIDESGVMSNSIGMKLKMIPVGAFAMGSNEGESVERPVHDVQLSTSYLIGVYEVTQEQYERVMGSNPSEFSAAQNPVEQVSWNDAVEFCRKLSELPEEKAAGHVYRLPTEAEWEYACRSGTTAAYSFGASASRLGDHAWYDSNSDSKPQQVGTKQPNEWGLYDMHGNVWEWCQDWFGEYPSDSSTDPTGASTGASRVYRGGGWFDDAKICRSAYRRGYYPSARVNNLGFRVALSPPDQ